CASASSAACARAPLPTASWRRRTRSSMRSTSATWRNAAPPERGRAPGAPHTRRPERASAGRIRGWCETRAFGFLASGYLTPAQLEEQLRQLRSRTRRPFGVNVFTPAAHASDRAVYAPYAEEIRRWADERGLPVGEPAFDDDGFAEKLDLLARDPAAVVSFTFGMPGRDTIGRLHAAGSEVWGTVTTPSEA